MGKVILQEFVTLNGIAAGPNDSVDLIPGSTQGSQTFDHDQMQLMNRFGLADLLVPPSAHAR